MDVRLLIVFAAAALAGTWAGARIQAEKDAQGKMIAPARGRDLWVPGWLWALSIAFLALLLLALFHPLIDPVGERIRRALSSLEQAGEIRITEDANGSDVGPWRLQRGFSGGASLQADPAPGRRGKNGALRVTFDIEGAHDTIAVEVPGEHLPDSVVLAIAWVYVESSEAVSAAGLHARLAGKVIAGRGRFSLLGVRTPLKPGTWTQVVLPVSYTVELSPELGGDSTWKRAPAKERLENLSVRLEADGPFRGSVFVDDLILFAPR